MNIPFEERRSKMKFITNKWVANVLLWVFVVLVWQIAAVIYGPDIIPGPIMTWNGALELLADGSLLSYIGISFYRVFVGWSLGSLLAIPLGLIIGRVTIVRIFAEPFLNFIRFIPPIAFITLFLVWFGIGEQSKIALILYATLFIVIMNTLTGVLAVEEDKIRAARSLGASEWQILIHVVIPSTIPYMFTGIRLAMGTSYMAIIGAEMIAANEGLGYLIWNSRLFFRTDWIFVGLICLGLIGFFTDRLVGLLGKKMLFRYGVISSEPIRR